jgi:hypothetical protein
MNPREYRFGKFSLRPAQRQVLVDGQPQIEVDEKDIAAGDALFDEIEHFVEMVRTRGRPLVDGRAEGGR